MNESVDPLKVAQSALALPPPAGRWPRSARRRLALTLSSRRMERGQRPRLQGARQFPPIAPP